MRGENTGLPRPSLVQLDSRWPPVKTRTRSYRPVPASAQTFGESQNLSEQVPARTRGSSVLLKWLIVFHYLLLHNFLPCWRKPKNRGWFTCDIRIAHVTPRCVFQPRGQVGGPWGATWPFLWGCCLGVLSRTSGGLGHRWRNWEEGLGEGAGMGWDERMGPSQRKCPEYLPGTRPYKVPVCLWLLRLSRMGPAVHRGTPWGTIYVSICSFHLQ